MSFVNILILRIGLLLRGSIFTLMLTQAQIHAYNLIRQPKARKHLCHAPFSSLNFEQNGNVTACCYNRSFVLGHIPDQELKDIWWGEKAEQLRKYIIENDLSGGCSACAEVIQSGNYKGTKAIFYDEYASSESMLDKISALFKGKKPIDFPKVFEFELSNSCNLECIMCNGYFSSAIRKNREKLPAIKNHYGESFVQQLEPFIPHLTDVKFLGGEPFLIDIYYKIWDEIIQVKPNMKIHITTNGTVLNKKVKEYLEKLNAGIVLSIDSLNESNYEKIRVNARFSELRNNIDYFIDYARRKKTYLSFAVCPIKANRYDMPEMVQFCNEYDIRLHFNTVWTPESESLRFVDETELERIIKLHESHTFKASNAIQRANVDNLNNFTEQLRSWRDEAKQNENIRRTPEKWKHFFQQLNKENLLVFNEVSREILQLEQGHYSENITPEKDADFQRQLNQLGERVSPPIFLKAYTDSLCIFASVALTDEDAKVFVEKIQHFEQLIIQLEKPDDLMKELIRTGFLFQFNFFREMSVDQILQLTKNRFKLITS